MLFRESYTCGVLVSGNVIQVSSYENPIVFGVQESSDFIPPSSPKDAPASALSSLLVQRNTSQELTDTEEGRQFLAGLGLTAEERAKKQASLARKARARFARKVSSNFGLYSANLQQESGEYLKFLTLTFKRNVIDRKEAHGLFAAFLSRLSYYMPIEYVCVPERQLRGAWHYHLIVKSAFIEKKLLRKVWSDRPECGSWHLRKIEGISNVGSYLASYMGKTFGDKADIDKKAKRFYTSKGIKDLSTLYRMSTKTYDWLQPMGDLPSDRHYSFVADWVGKVDFREYVFPNDAVEEVALFAKNVSRYGTVA